MTFIQCSLFDARRLTPVAVPNVCCRCLLCCFCSRLNLCSHVSGMTIPCFRPCVVLWQSVKHWKISARCNSSNSNRPLSLCSSSNCSTSSTSSTSTALLHRHNNTANRRHAISSSHSSSRSRSSISPCNHLQLVLAVAVQPLRQRMRCSRPRSLPSPLRLPQLSIPVARSSAVVEATLPVRWLYHPLRQLRCCDRMLRNRTYRVQLPRRINKSHHTTPHELN